MRSYNRSELLLPIRRVGDEVSADCSGIATAADGHYAEAVWWPLTTRRELPGWLRAYDDFGGIVLTLVMLGVGIVYVVMGNTSGRVVGVVLIAVAVAVILFIARRRCIEHAEDE